MIVYYSGNHKKHNPKYEIYDGVPTRYAESSARAESIIRNLRGSNYTIRRVKRFSLDYISEVHDKNYVSYLKNTSSSLIKREELYPSYYISDTYAPISHGTFAAAISSVETALSGADAIIDGEHHVYSLCRPPGHHACNRSMGGYCYLNNAAIAANYLSSKGNVAILDIDFHHGNGTQEIFYKRKDVIYISLHADPKSNYPYTNGYREEVGEGEGYGYNFNLPLLPDVNESEYLEALNTCIGKVDSFNPDYLVVSLGFDTYIDDPIGGLNLHKDVYREVAKRIAKLNLPTLLIQEGGYNLEALPGLVNVFLSSFKL